MAHVSPWARLSGLVAYVVRSPARPVTGCVGHWPHLSRPGCHEARSGAREAIETFTKDPTGHVALDTLSRYPFSSGSAGVVDKVRLQRVVDVMRQFLGFDSAFNINSMLLNES
jgi:hypothetical protein